MIVAGREAGGFASGAVDIDRDATAPADEVVVIIAHAVFVESRGAGRLDAADEAFLAQESQRVVDRLLGNGADLSTGVIANDLSRSVRMG